MGVGVGPGATALRWRSLSPSGPDTKGPPALATLPDEAFLLL